MRQYGMKDNVVDYMELVACIAVENKPKHSGKVLLTEPVGKRVTDSLTGA